MLPFVLNRSKTALLISDLQKGYCEVGGDIAKALGWDCSPLHEVCERHLSFLAEVRNLLPPEHIIWTHMEENEETLAPNLPMDRHADFHRLCLRGTLGFDYHLVAPEPHEREILKTHLSAFHKDARVRAAGSDAFAPTDSKTEKDDPAPALHAYLHEKGIDTIAFSGVFATRCVYANIIGGSTFGYNCICLSDLVAVPRSAFFERERKAHDLTQNMLYSYPLSSQEFLSALRPIVNCTRAEPI
jgi:nicotinamidase-related amidase